MKEISRRKWLGVFTTAAVGAGVLNTSSASAADKAKTDTFNIKDYGAIGDGKTLNTKAIQKAIDACHQQNGGTVIIPAGVFICSTLELKSNVTLHVTAGGKLLGSPKREDYTAGKGVPPGNGNIVFLYAVNASNVSIEGKGIIDGNGLAFYNGKGDNTGPGQRGIGGNFDRPHLAVFYQCTDLTLRDTKLLASAYHCVRLLQCKHIHIDGIYIYNRVNKNNDGFHFNSCEYVHMINCDVLCQDDACALFGSNKFVTITNCSFSTRWAIFRFGGGQSQNITITNCLIYETYGCAIKISAGKAGIENLSFSNITMRNVTGPIGIGFSGGEGAFIRNVTFNNIRATVVAQPVPHPDIHFELNFKEGEKNSCITLNAMGSHYLENISFTDVHVKYAGGGTAEQAKKVVPEIAAEYFGVWDQLPGGPPAYGLYARNVKRLTLQNVRFEHELPEARPAIILDNVEDAAINGLSIQGTEADAAIRCINSKDILITAARLLTPANKFLQTIGDQCRNIKVEGGDLSKEKGA